MTVGTETDTGLAERVERLEEVVVALAVDRYGGTGDLGEIRRAVKAALPELTAEVRERVRQRISDATPRCQYTGEDLDDVIAFAGDLATVRQDNGATWLICQGKPTRVFPGTWLAKDNVYGRILVTEFHPERR